jgi:hypothetical protein
MKSIIVVLMLVVPLAPIGCSDRTQTPGETAPESKPAAQPSPRASSQKTVTSALSERAAPAPVARTTPRRPVSDRSQKPTAAPSPIAKNHGVTMVRFVLAERIEAREPIGPKTTFAPGKRVYAFLELDNENGNPYSLIVRFERDGGPRGTGLRLEIPRMKRYRTNAFSANTSQPGTYRCIVTTEDGKIAAKQTFTVAGTAR